MTADTALHVVEGGEPESDWEAVYRANVELIYRFVHARTGNRADAEDITSQVFLRALPHLQVSAAEPEIRAYLIRTARTAIADFWSLHYRIAWGGPLDDLAADADESDAADGSTEPPGSHRVERLLARLSPTHRRVLELRFLRGYTIKETAAAMGITVTNAKVTQWRALRQAAAMEERE